jgi:hypothetical protein
LKLEETHKQWFKHSLCFIVLASLIIVNLLRGSKSNPSIIEGYTKCLWYDFTLCAIFLVACICVTYAAIKRVNYEQYYKIKYAKGICKSDLKFAPNIVKKLITVALVAGLVSGGLGLGGGSIFNPVLLGMGIPPAVSSATGMYLVMFTAFGSSVTYLILKTLDI